MASGNQKITLDASNIYYRQLNELIRRHVAEGAREFELHNVNGQRYIGGCLKGDLRLTIHGVPGQDLASFMSGPTLQIHGNVQDGVANTMDDGLIVVHGMAGDVLGYGMRGGKVLVEKDVGYRVGIHMKAYMDKVPVVVVGGTAGDFLGEYMAGGAIILLGMYTNKPWAPITGRSLGTGMHGGVIYIRSTVQEHLLGPGLHAEELDEADTVFLKEHVELFAREMDKDAKEILDARFVKVKPFTHRPYGNMYVGTN